MTEVYPSSLHCESLLLFEARVNYRPDILLDCHLWYQNWCHVCRRPVEWCQLNTRSAVHASVSSTQARVIYWSVPVVSWLVSNFSFLSQKTQYTFKASILEIMPCQSSLELTASISALDFALTFRVALQCRFTKISQYYLLYIILWSRLASSDFLPQVGELMSEFPLEPELAKVVVDSPRFRSATLPRLNWESIVAQSSKSYTISQPACLYEVHQLISIELVKKIILALVSCLLCPRFGKHEEVQGAEYTSLSISVRPGLPFLSLPV